MRTVPCALQTLCSDVQAVVKTMYGDAPPAIVLVGHRFVILLRKDNLKFNLWPQVNLVYENKNKLRIKRLVYYTLN